MADDNSTSSPPVKKRLVATKMASITRQIISTAKAPAAIGPYVQATLVNNTLYLSGAIGLNPKNGNMVEGGVEAETHQALRNLGGVLEAAGCTYKNVVDTTVLLSTMDNFAKVNAIYAEYFKEPYPARACFAVAGLPKGALFEIKAVAVVGEIQES
ncbi:hypothetical protein QR680_012702 [Steinernema hermaphroditum]|uniref:2-iminobutanoate/2-iminopropanoate deaminase n=1 Tax=Steinernema hermaphroditum TaxID=289476 RepID=A0AA39I481_9BILA|nr:hypothetical protein QR680_012702 [Steinernema hermaphroditum]